MDRIRAISPSDHDESGNDTGGEPPAKMRRTSRACTQCRSRKQRCQPNPTTSSLNAKCSRCRQLQIECSFEQEPVITPLESTTPAGLAKEIHKLQTQLALHARRIEILERGQGSFTSPSSYSANLRQNLENTEYLERHAETTAHEDLLAFSGRHVEQPTLAIQLDTTTPATATSNSPGFSMDTINLGPPIATLRSLAQMVKTNGGPEVSSMSYDPILPVVFSPEHIHFAVDPIQKNIISLNDAVSLVNIFFERCHGNAPLLSRTRWQAAIPELRRHSPTLFLSLCCVGARFWNNNNNMSSTGGGTNLHPQYFQLVDLLDTGISRLLLRPTLADASLDNIRVLLLYIQWMSFSKEPQSMASKNASSSPFKSRYNDLSAFAVLGLAIRYAKFLGLDRLAPAPFVNPATSDQVTNEDFSRMRIWLNLLTCEAHLTLSAGLPATLEADPAAQVGRAFSSHPSAEQPYDRRVAAICELVVIVQEAAKSSGDPSARHLSPQVLKRANLQFDQWEATWYGTLRATPFQHCAIPFTSMRWYRFALNSACLAPLIANTAPPSGFSQLHLLQSLDLSLTAAAQILISLASGCEQLVYQLQSQEAATFPVGALHVDTESLDRFQTAVDSTWITHSFGLIFLVLCYTRGIIDDELQICALRGTAQYSHHCSPHPPRPISFLRRLTALAGDIFQQVCKTMVAHPALDYQVIVQNAQALLFTTHTDEGESDNMLGPAEDLSSMQDFFELLVGSGYQWPTTLYEEPFAFASTSQ